MAKRGKTVRRGRAQRRARTQRRARGRSQRGGMLASLRWVVPHDPP